MMEKLITDCVAYHRKYLFSTRRRRDLFCHCVVSFSVSVLLLLSNVAEAKLALTKECGEIVCDPHYYCSNFDHLCRPCRETCDKVLSNYDKNLCEKECQDYLHDLFYMRRGNESVPDEKVQLIYDDIQQELLTLKILVMITIIISTAVMIALFILVIYLKKSRNRLGISNPNWCWGKNEEMELPVVYSNSKCFTLPRIPNTTESVPNLTNDGCNNNTSTVSSPDVISRSESAIPVTVPSVHKLPLAEPPSKKRGSQKFRREPSESTLPEYVGYDNPALCSSPIPAHM